MPLRGELVGMGAIAATLFAKQASGLDDTEAAIIAALVRAPTPRPSGGAARLRCWRRCKRCRCDGASP